MGYFLLPSVCLIQSLYVLILQLGTLRSCHQLFLVDRALFQMIEQKRGDFIHHIKD